MLRGLKGTFVVAGRIPGFREGAIVDIETGRAACYLTPEDHWLLMRYRHCLHPLESPQSAESPRPSNPEVAARLRVVE